MIPLAALDALMIFGHWRALAILVCPFWDDDIVSTVVWLDPGRRLCWGEALRALTSWVRARLDAWEGSMPVVMFLLWDERRDLIAQDEHPLLGEDYPPPGGDLRNRFGSALISASRRICLQAPAVRRSGAMNGPPCSGSAFMDGITIRSPRSAF